MAATYVTVAVTATGGSKGVWHNRLMAKPAGLDDVLEQVRHLSTLDKVRLIGRVAPEIERELTSGSEPRAPKRSLWGLLAPLGQAPSAEEIDYVRREVWQGFPRDDV